METMKEEEVWLPKETREKMKTEEIVWVLDLAQAELRAMYKRLGINGSNVLDMVDTAHDILTAQLQNLSPE